MLRKGFEQFRGKRILLLQGPVGPFFARLAQDLRTVDAEVYKINFNAGDWIFYPNQAINYRGTMQDWPAWLEELLIELNIDIVQLFGDCRPIHRAACQVASKLNIEIQVFEEGYVRPDYVTLELNGVNGFSRLSLDPEAFSTATEVAVQTPKKLEVPNAYWSMVAFSMVYFLIGSLGKFWFRHYQHHRPLSILEALPWIRSAWRKLWYRWSERGQHEELTLSWHRKYYLVPLQVFNDSQLTEHSDCESIDLFIESTLISFAQHAPGDTLLVFKHHPMDRGYKDYTGLLQRLSQTAGISHRVRYIHDQHLPSLLDHARGVVIVNSTVGLSALHHQAPTKVCGRALYNLPGLTYQGTLDEFWNQAQDFKPNRDLYQRFRMRLINRTQLNGSFYKPLKKVHSQTGLVWSGISFGKVKKTYKPKKQKGLAESSLSP
jgi:capsular polysaccharide export protein